MPLLLKVDEAARLSGISRSFAWQLVQRRVWPGVRIGRALRINRAWLEAWIEEQTAAAQADGQTGNTSVV